MIEQDWVVPHNSQSKKETMYELMNHLMSIQQKKSDRDKKIPNLYTQFDLQCLAPDPLLENILSYAPSIPFDDFAELKQKHMPAWQR